MIGFNCFSSPITKTFFALNNIGSALIISVCEASSKIARSKMPELLSITFPTDSVVMLLLVKILFFANILSLYKDNVLLCSCC